MLEARQVHQNFHNDQDHPDPAKQAKEARKKQQDQVCKRAENYLKSISSGPVDFFDEQGRSLKVTEKERQAKEREWRDYIDQNC